MVMVCDHGTEKWYIVIILGILCCDVVCYDTKSLKNYKIKLQINVSNRNGSLHIGSHVLVGLGLCIHSVVIMENFWRGFLWNVTCVPHLNIQVIHLWTIKLFKNLSKFTKNFTFLPGLGALNRQCKAVHHHHVVGIHLSQQQPHHLCVSKWVYLWCIFIIIICRAHSLQARFAAEALL